MWSSVGNKKKNYQCGLDDKEDESNGKIFERPRSKRCPVKFIEKYLSQLNPDYSSLVQKLRSPCKSFNPAKDAVWYCSTPLSHNTLDNMPRFMTTRTGRNPRNSTRAATITVLSVANIEIRHIKAITGHQSKASIQSYFEIRAVQINVKLAWQVPRSGTFYNCVFSLNVNFGDSSRK